MEFGSAKEAGLYQLQNPLPGNDRWEIVTTGNGKFGLKIIPGPEDVVTRAPPGADPESDALHMEEAKQEQTKIEDMQEVLAKNSPFAESQQIVRELLADQGLEDQNVYMHAPALAALMANMTPQETMNLINPEGDRDIWEHFWNAVDGNAEWAIPKSQYLAATNGKSWAGDVNVITRFSEAGISTAEGKTLRPEAPPAAEEPEPGQFTKLSELHQVAPKPGGSQPGAVYEDTNGDHWLVKGSHEPDEAVREDRARNEVLAGALMNAAMPGTVPELRLIDLEGQHGGGVGVASKMNYDLEPFDKNDAEHRVAVYRTFATQAWLANWDALGLDLDNTMIDRSGHPVAIDLGGALRYRAMGSPKGDAFGPVPNEWTSMRQGNSKAQQVFGAMTSRDLLKSAAYLKNVTDQEIHDLVEKYGPKDEAERDKLEAYLLERQARILNEASKLGPVPEPTTMKEPSEAEWAEIEDLLKEPEAVPPPAFEPGPLQPDPDLTSTENEALALQLPGLKAAANQVANEIWLRGLFGDGAALGMSGKELEQWSAKVQVAQQAVYERLLKAAKERIKKFRKPEWARAYNAHFNNVQAEFYERPGVKAWTQLTTPQVKGGEGKDLVSGNALVANGKPVTFYRATNRHDTGPDNEALIDLFANPRAPTIPHPHWINTVAHSHYNGASFAEDPKFAENWSHQYPYQDPAIYSTELRPITYVTHVYVPRHKLGDFRNPQDVLKAMQWWQKSYGGKQASYESDQAYALRVSTQKHRYTNGDWGPWEAIAMLQAVGWDAVRMLEKPHHSKDKPNLFVINPEAIYWKYDNASGVPQNIRLLLSDRAAVSPDVLKKLPKGIWDKAGQPVEDFAAELGMTGPELLDELGSMNANRGKQPFKQWLERQIKAETAMRAQDQLGWDLSKESLLEAAREMVDTPVLEDLLTESLTYLARRFGLGFDKDMILNEAKEAFLQTPVKDALNIGLQERTLWRLMRKVEKGLLGTNQQAVLDAFKARQDALKAHYKLREALAFQKKYAAARRNWQSMARQATIKGMDQDFLNHIHFNLAEMQQKVNRQPDELMDSLNGLTTVQFAARLFAATSQQLVLADIPVDPSKLNTPYKGLTPEKMQVRDFENIREMIVSLRKLGRAAQRAYTETQNVRLLTIAVRVAINADKLGRRYTPAKLQEDASKSIGASGSIPMWPVEVADAFGRGAGRLANVSGGMMIRPEVYLYYLDQNGWGPLSQFVTKVLQDGRYYEDDLHKKIMMDLQEFYDTQPDGWEGTMKRKVNIPDLIFANTPWIKTRGMAVVTALNLGTMENMNALLKGFKWSYEDVLGALEKVLTKADWDFVQKIWDIHEHTLWPEIVRTYRDKTVSGVPPRKKVNRTFTVRTADGQEQEMRGGYYGIHYDTMQLERRGLKNPAIGQVPSEMLGGEFESSAPSNNYTKSVTGFVAPLDLSFRLIPFRINQIIHDVSWRKPLIQAHKVLNQPDVVIAMQEVLGPQYPKLTKEWLQYIAREAVHSGSGADGWAGLIRGARTNFIAVQVLFKIKTIFLHSAIAAAHVTTEGGRRVVPAAYNTFVQAGLDFVRTPGQMSFWNKFIDERSGEIRNIEYGIDRDVRDTVLKLESKEGPLAAVPKLGYSMFAFLKKMEGRVTWLARYREVMADVGGDKFGKYSGGNEEAAIYLANKAVRDTQGAGGVMDLPPMLRSSNEWRGELLKLVATPFMGFRNATFNRGWRMSMAMRRVMEGRGTKKDFDMVGALVGFFIMPSLIWGGEAKLYSNEQASLPSLIAQGVAHNTIGSIPYGDLVIDVMSSMLEGKGMSGVRASPEAELLAGAFGLPWEGVHLLGEAAGVAIPGPKEPVRAVVDSLGYYGLPFSDQFGITAQYATDVVKGEQNPQSVQQALHDAAAGPPKAAPSGKRGGSRRSNKRG
jgi:hypothetical protein